MSVTIEPNLRLEEAEDTGARPYEWTVAQFYRAIRAGAFEYPERLELLDGEIIEHMAPQETPHIQATLLTAQCLAKVFGNGTHVRTQTPLDICGKTEPEPDVMVVKGDLRDYDARKPAASDVLLVVEVADATLRLDRARKAAIYARAGIRDYWIVNLRARTLEVYRDLRPLQGDPLAFGYESITGYTEDELVTPLATPESPIRVADLLPAAKNKS